MPLDLQESPLGPLVEWLVLARPWPRGEERLRCRVCGATEALTKELALAGSPSEVERVVRAFIAAHRHEPPKPLTREEREQELVRMRHRRGALRFM